MEPNMLKVELENKSSLFRPGDLLLGKIIWEMSEVPCEITARLAWATEGKGDDDGAWVIEQSWSPNTANGSKKFRWQLPRGPLSLDGTLIRIRWTVECNADGSDEEYTVPIVLSHLNRPVILTNSK